MICGDKKLQSQGNEEVKMEDAPPRYQWLIIYTVALANRSHVYH